MTYQAPTRSDLRKAETAELQLINAWKNLETLRKKFGYRDAVITNAAATTVRAIASAKQFKKNIYYERGGD
jgi:hypothetical protein